MKRLLTITATIISVIFSPLFNVPVALLWGMYFFTDAKEARIASLYIFAIGIIPVILMFIYLKYTKRISDWDIQIRNERHRLNIFGIICGAALLVLLKASGLTPAFIFMSWVYIGFFLFSLITFFWKISGHTAAMTFLVLFTISVYGVKYLWLIFLIPLVGWSRVHLGKHTAAQVAGGFMLSGVIFYGAHFLNLLS